MMKSMRVLLLSAALLSLTACGLHLRGHGPGAKEFAFHSIYIQAPAETTFTKTLRRNLTSYKLVVQPTPGQQDLTLNVAYETTDKQITALNASGHVIEYLLRYRVSLRASDRQQREWLPPSEIQLQRILPYDDTLVLAKQQEEQMLYDDMRVDAAQQVLRRLIYARPPKPGQEENPAPENPEGQENTPGGANPPGQKSPAEHPLQPQ